MAKKTLPKLARLELQILEILWARGQASVREIQEGFPEPRPAYTTVQTTVGRLETKKAIARVKKIGGANIYDVLMTRGTAQSRLIEDFLALFGGRVQPIMAHFVEAGKLTLADVQRVEQHLHELAAQEKEDGKS